MECTQKLECTQELYETYSERTCPDQIGFLGICGKKYPVLKGPNKVGRDPHTCSIVLNLNSVSRQHAVINVLNSRDFMLMDLDSANKTKLLNKTLQPYIPHPLNNGDTVQFGDIFGIFRLLVEDDDLPMTQALDIPDTPIAHKPVSRVNKAPTTVIPESPDVSDRDDSFITPSQPKGKMSAILISQLLKSTKQSLSSPKRDSSLDSSKRSSTLSYADNPNTSLNESFVPNIDKTIANNIHEMDTQPQCAVANDSNDSIYTADTQIPPQIVHSPSIHSLATQLPEPVTEHLPQVRKINDQHEMQFDIIYGAKKANDESIFDAETQPFLCDKINLMESVKNLANTSHLKDKTISNCSPLTVSKEKNNTSEDELLFEEIDDECFLESNSQNILPEELPFKDDSLEKLTLEKGKPTPSKRDNRIKSDCSTDCEDMLPTQKVQQLPIKKNEQQEKLEVKNEVRAAKKTTRIKSDSSTDCEDIDLIPTQKISQSSVKTDVVKQKDSKNNAIKPLKRLDRLRSDSSTDCEDIDIIPTQKIPVEKVDLDDDITDCEEEVNDINTKKPNLSSKSAVTKFEDMPTQVIDFDDNQINKSSVLVKSAAVMDASDIEDQSTQIIDEIIPNDTERTEKSLDLVSPFKIPLQSRIKVKSKDFSKLTLKDKTPDKGKRADDDDNYYNSTQDIYEDLCTQRGPYNVDEEVVPCSVENYKVGEKFAGINRELSPRQQDERISNYVAGLTSQEVRNVIGVENVQVSKLRRVPSDSSDDSTPKKLKPLLFTDSDLPSSQEIKTSVRSITKSLVTESSSESETENYSDESPFLGHIDIDKLPDRVITRVRKPPSRLGDDETSINISRILKPIYLLKQEDQIDADIIAENIKRLKAYKKAKAVKDSKEIAHENSKESSTSQKKKSPESKEKIKVKIEKPKRKDTKSKGESSARKSDESDKNNKTKSKEDSSSKSTTRKTRSTQKEGGSKKTEDKSITLENSKKEPASKRTRTNKKEEKSKSPEIEIRRSKRQHKPKEKTVVNEPTKPKSILKNSHEQSTVYNISSSSSDSPKSSKRSLDDNSDVPGPKRARTANVTSNSSGISNASLRATPARTIKKQHVLLTAFHNEEVRLKLEKLGAVIVTDVLDCTVVLTLQVKRTFKLLCALGLGRPIVGPSWVQACVDTHMIVDPWLYLVKDEPSEKRFQFSLTKTLSGKRNFLKGYNVSSTPNVQPNAFEMKLIVECSGGTWKEGGPNWMCVSCTKDKGLWPSLRKRGATVVTTEFILGGVLRQKLDIAANTFK